MKTVLIAIVFCIFADIVYSGTIIEEKKKELNQLQKIISEARNRIKGSSSTKGRDYLKLLPSFAISRHAPYSGFAERENSFSASINTNQIFEITDVYYKRKTAKKKAQRRVQSCGFKIRKLIERKYLIKSKIWKFKQIKKSMDDPIEITKIDDRIDEHLLKLQETEIEIENAHAEIEYVCVEVEG